MLLGICILHAENITCVMSVLWQFHNTGVTSVVQKV
jgi:hypothetical protein